MCISFNIYTDEIKELKGKNENTYTFIGSFFVIENEVEKIKEVLEEEKTQAENPPEEIKWTRVKTENSDTFKIC